MQAISRANSSAMLRNMRFTCYFLSPDSFAECPSDRLLSYWIFLNSICGRASTTRTRYRSAQHGSYHIFLQTYEQSLVGFPSPLQADSSRIQAALIPRLP